MDNTIINILLMMLVMFITSILLHFIDGILLGNCSHYAQTFSKIRNDFCDGCIVFPTCVTACKDFCNHISHDCLITNVEVKELYALGAMKTFKVIEDRATNYIKFL